MSDSEPLQLYRKLHAVSTRLHSARSLDALMSSVPADLCHLFDCDRCLLFVMDQEQDYLVAREARVAVTPGSIAGHVALTQQVLNIADVYDASQLRDIAPDLQFQQGADQRTGYRTRQVLAAPIADAQGKELLGVVQLLNSRSGEPFSANQVECLRDLCETLAVALAARQSTRFAAAAGSTRPASAAEIEAAALAEKIIEDACRLDASDIHIEPQAARGVIVLRLRRDGALLPYAEAALELHATLVARLKTMCGLPASPAGHPIEGKLLFREFSQLDVELRATFIPSAGGMEDVVLHLFSSGAPMPLERLGMQAATQDRLRAAIDTTHGLFLLCGPAGSGRTAALHALLLQLERPDAKVWTIEEPLEIVQPGARQIPVRRDAGTDFPAALRAVLHADPDQVAIGDMRDGETAALAIAAATAGRMVLGALPTASTTDAIARLHEMGNDRFAMADTLLGVLALRLAKRLCEHCKQAYQPGEAEMDLLLAEYSEELQKSESWRADPRTARQRIVNGWRERYGAGRSLRLYLPVGCKECSHGYKGRIGLHELLVPGELTRQLVRERASAPQLRNAALAEGMRTLRMDGIEKILAGLSDVKAIRAAL
ncbi:GspE/PulE family protein [Pseudoduganella violaceinigra]|uniref:GspE/PulE family protein n=1 Tax=Pseudoduganella violaceinigra TaxID=246602 RepID=UPI00040B8CCD|nr:ATPase, T2SS/T4P/T4SS family [Pseudoduganella violaceinigra]